VDACQLLDAHFADSFVGDRRNSRAALP
jgi:hypothetical protein